MADDSEITNAAAILRGGGLVAFPTETVYGLGANALDERAVARVFEVKARPRFDPLIVHVAEMRWLGRLTTDFPPLARRLAERFWPGPLTLVLPKTSAVPDLVTAGGLTVAIRIPDHPVALRLLRAVDLPIAAPSANPFGQISPTCAEHVREQLGPKIDLILDGGLCRVGVESTVLQLTPEGPLLLRPGGTTLEEIEGLIGKVQLPVVSQAGLPGPALVSPGTLAQHYAPRTALVLRTGEMASAGKAELDLGWRVGLLAFRASDDDARFDRVEVLSRTGDLREAAANLFAALRRLDAAGLDLIVAEKCPDIGLGRALNDRLRRAAHS
ncbi:MAG TPA: L-threonylcarbamoyladenylate synthase [Planctomycetaceae bacterium]|jgi:L-threonylcarbamoyladenylate synthase